MPTAFLAPSTGFGVARADNPHATPALEETCAPDMKYRYTDGNTGTAGVQSGDIILEAANAVVQQPSGGSATPGDKRATEATTTGTTPFGTEMPGSTRGDSVSKRPQTNVKDRPEEEVEQVTQSSSAYMEVLPSSGVENQSAKGCSMSPGGAAVGRACSPAYLDASRPLSGAPDMSTSPPFAATSKNVVAFVDKDEPPLPGPPFCLAAGLTASVKLTSEAGAAQGSTLSTSQQPEHGDEILPREDSSTGSPLATLLASEQSVEAVVVITDVTSLSPSPLPEQELKPASDGELMLGESPAQDAMAPKKTRHVARTADEVLETSSLLRPLSSTPGRQSTVAGASNDERKPTDALSTCQDLVPGEDVAESGAGSIFPSSSSEAEALTVAVGKRGVPEALPTEQGAPHSTLLVPGDDPTTAIASGDADLALETPPSASAASVSKAPIAGGTGGSEEARRVPLLLPRSPSEPTAAAAARASAPGGSPATGGPAPREERRDKKAPAALQEECFFQPVVAPPPATCPALLAVETLAEEEEEEEQVGMEIQESCLPRGPPTEVQQLPKVGTRRRDDVSSRPAADSRPSLATSGDGASAAEERMAEAMAAAPASYVLLAEAGKPTNKESIEDIDPLESPLATTVSPEIGVEDKPTSTVVSLEGGVGLLESRSATVSPEVDVDGSQAAARTQRGVSRATTIERPGAADRRAADADAAAAADATVATAAAAAVQVEEQVTAGEDTVTAAKTDDEGGGGIPVFPEEGAAARTCQQDHSLENQRREEGGGDKIRGEGGDNMTGEEEEEEGNNTGADEAAGNNDEQGDGNQQALLVRVLPAQASPRLTTSGAGLPMEGTTALAPPTAPSAPTQTPAAPPTASPSVPAALVVAAAPSREGGLAGKAEHSASNHPQGEQAGEPAGEEGLNVTMEGTGVTAKGDSEKVNAEKEPAEERNDRSDDGDKKEARLEALVREFNSWIASSVHFPVRKVEAGLVGGGGMRLGAVATEAIARGQLYLSVRDAVVLDAAKVRIEARAGMVSAGVVETRNTML